MKSYKKNGYLVLIETDRQTDRLPDKVIHRGAPRNLFGHFPRP